MEVSNHPHFCSVNILILRNMTEEKFILNRIADALEKIAHRLYETVANPVIACTNNSVTITCATSGATIHYTTDGSTPTKESDVYSSAISITEDKTFKAIAIKADMNGSEVVTQECEYVPESIA